MSIPPFKDSSLQLHQQLRLHDTCCLARADTVIYRAPVGALVQSCAMANRPTDMQLEWESDYTLHQHSIRTAGMRGLMTSSAD